LDNFLTADVSSMWTAVDTALPREYMKLCQHPYNTIELDIAYCYLINKNHEVFGKYS